MTTPEERIARRMKAARRRLGVSQEDVARRLGVSLRTYARWERYESLGFLGRLGEIARALEMGESDLLGGENLLTDGPTVRDLATKLDEVMEELALLRRDLEAPDEPA